MKRARSPYQHDATRDTQWVGKGVGSPWWIFLAIVVVAAAIAYLVGG